MFSKLSSGWVETSFEEMAITSISFLINSLEIGALSFTRNFEKKRTYKNPHKAIKEPANVNSKKLGSIERGN